MPGTQFPAKFPARRRPLGWRYRDRILWLSMVMCKRLRWKEEKEGVLMTSGSSSLTVKRTNFYIKETTHAVLSQAGTKNTGHIWRRRFHVDLAWAGDTDNEARNARRSAASTTSCCSNNWILERPGRGGTFYAWTSPSLTWVCAACRAGECAAPQNSVIRLHSRGIGVGTDAMWWLSSVRSRRRPGHHGYDMVRLAKGKCESISPFAVLQDGGMKIRAWRTACGIEAWISYAGDWPFVDVTNWRYAFPAPGRWITLPRHHVIKPHILYPDTKLTDVVAWHGTPLCYRMPRPKKRTETALPPKTNHPERHIAQNRWFPQDEVRSAPASNPILLDRPANR